MQLVNKYLSDIEYKRIVYRDADVTQSPELTLQPNYKAALQQMDERTIHRFNKILGAQILTLTKALSVSDLLEAIYGVYSKRDINNTSSWTVGDLSGRVKSAVYKMSEMGVEIDEILRKNVGNKKYCDVSCGDGTLGLVFATRYSLQPCFMDIEDNIAAKIKEMYGFALYDRNEDIKSDVKYGVISCFHVLHHIDSVDLLRQRIKNIYELLDTDGVFIFAEHEILSDIDYAMVLMLHEFYAIFEMRLGMLFWEFIEWFQGYELLSLPLRVLNDICLDAGFKVMLKATSPVGLDRKYYAIYQK